MAVEISDATELQAMENDVTAAYEIVNDIDASGTSTWNSGEGFEPIGWTAEVDFTGSLDGGGFTVTGLFIDRTSFNQSRHVALFADRISTGFVRDLTLADIDFTSGGNTDTAAISTLIFVPLTNVHVSGSIDASGELFGIGAFRDKVTDCSTNLTLTGTADISAFGELETGADSFTRCRAAGSAVSTGGSVFGFAAEADIRFGNIDVTDCYSTVALTAADNEVISGFIGTVLDTTNVRTLTLQNVYAANDVTVGTGQTIVGLVNQVPDEDGVLDINDSFWDTDIGAATSNGGGTGKTTAEMQDIDTFTDTATVGLDTAWDMVLESNHDGQQATAVWFIDDGVAYPQLWFEFEAAAVGAGTKIIGMNSVDGRIIGGGS